MGVDAEFYIVKPEAWTERDIDCLDHALREIEEDLHLDQFGSGLCSEEVTQFGDRDAFQNPSRSLPHVGVSSLKQMRLVYPGFRYTDEHGGHTALPVLAMMLTLQDLNMGDVLYGPDHGVPHRITPRLMAALAELAMDERHYALEQA